MKNVAPRPSPYNAAGKNTLEQNGKNTKWLQGNNKHFKRANQFWDLNNSNPKLLMIMLPQCFYI